MNANLFEKGVSLLLIGTSVVFVGAMYFKSPNVEKHDAFRVRQELLKRQDTKMLYSTMSFFYLQGFQSQSLDSFYNLQSIIDIEKPNLVALPISREEYESKYQKMMHHPKYREAMDKFIFDLKNKNEDSIKNMTDFSLKNLEKLYLIDACHKIKNCKIVCGRRSNEEYSNMNEIYKKMEKTNQNFNLDLGQMKVEDYTENILQEMKPAMKFSILPQSPYKTILGLIQPELLKKTAQKWKQKFHKNYSHLVIQDQEVLEREKLMRQSQNKPV